MRTADLVRLPLLMAASVVLTCALVLALARWSPIIPNHVARELERERAVNGLYLYDHGYIDDGDYVLAGQAPLDDFSRGGVYFMGDSQMNAAIRTWELPPEERALIHNYALGDLRYRELRQFIEMLVEDFALLSAGGDKTTIFIGLSRYMARPLNYEIGGYTKYALIRHGLYTYDPADRMRRVEMSALERWMRLMRNDAQRVLNIIFQTRPSRIKSFTPQEQTTEYMQLGDNWRAAMEREVGELARLLDYLQARGVHVRAFLRPSGSWENALPYQATHRALVVPLVEARGIPLIDQASIEPDSSFVDNTHSNYQARLELHRIDHQLALDALHEMGTDVPRP